MASWLDDAEGNGQGRRMSRKRCSNTAGLDDLVDAFGTKCKLSEDAAERFHVADKLIADPQFIKILMKRLPETCVRKMATTSSEWRKAACETLRARSRNNAFSLLWKCDPGKLPFGTREYPFCLSTFFHPGYLGKHAPRRGLRKRHNLPLEPRSANVETPPAEPDVVNQVEFILTYGTSNVEPDFDVDAWDENTTVRAAALGVSSLIVLSTSVIVTVPDGGKVISASPEIDRQLMTSILFPLSQHLCVESFLVPPDISSDSCVSDLIGKDGPNIKAKALVLYQYLNLVDTEPGVIEVLNSLSMTKTSSGFPMITGIYNYIEAGLLKQNGGPMDAIATGFLICGDEYCNASVLSTNLMKQDEEQSKDFEVIKDFFNANDFSTKYILLFHHTDVNCLDSGGYLKLESFVDSIKTELPTVKLHGIGSLSGAHSMFVNPDANQSFNKLNELMGKMIGSQESKESFATMEIALLLLSYQAD